MYFFDETQKLIEEAIGEIYCPGKFSARQNECTECKLCCQFLIFLSEEQKPKMTSLVGMVHFDLQKRRIATKKEKNHLLFWRFSSTNHNQ